MTGASPRHHAPEAGRLGLVPRLGIRPALNEVVAGLLDGALAEASAAAAAEGRPTVVLDAGCGRVSALRPFRARIDEIVGLDIHGQPPGSIGHLDRFVRADLCTDPDAFAPATFDTVLMSFTVEHLADPARGLANLATWTRPGGTLVATTVNRRHPFVAAYLGLPEGLRGRLQDVVKARPEDAHPLIGACNTVPALVAALERSGWTDVRVTTVGHLARAWRRTWPTFAVGVAGDVATRGMPARRSTIVAAARRSGGAASR